MVQHTGPWKGAQSGPSQGGAGWSLSGAQAGYRGGYFAGIGCDEGEGREEMKRKIKSSGLCLHLLDINSL